MAHIVTIALEDAIPTLEAVLHAQSVPTPAQEDETLRDLSEQGIAIFRDLAKPVGIRAPVTQSEFETIYHGAGANDSITLLPPITQAADHMALYCVTLGHAVCDRIAELFDESSFALASMLDSTASVGAELASDVVLQEFERQLDLDDEGDDRTGVMPFSPGYCGWHVSGQRALFDFLRPEEIGVTLNDSCLMHPLKSISGILVAGAIDIFDFDDDFPFCSSCATRSCRARIASLTMNERPHKQPGEV